MGSANEEQSSASWQDPSPRQWPSRVATADRLRIAVIDPSAFTIPYDRHLCQSLASSGHRTVLFTRAERSQDYFSLTADPAGVTNPNPFRTEALFYQGRGWLHESRFRPLRLGHKAVQHVRSMRLLAARLRAFNPQVIHFQWLVLPAIDRLFIERIRRLAPVVLTVHDAEAFHAPTSRLQLFGWKRCLALFDRLIVHTAYTRSCLQEIGLPAERIVQIPHGLLTNAAPAAVADPPASPDGFCRLLFFGSIKAYKGLDVLIRALSLIPLPVRRNVRLRIVGRLHGSSGEIRQLVESCGVADQVEWHLGFFRDDELDRYLRESDAVVFPYRRIDASGALMTALPFRRPIIASRIGQFNELLQDRQSALLVTPDNPQELANAIAEIAQNSDLKAQLAAGLSEAVQRVPVWDEIAQQTVAVYRGCTAARANQN